MTAGAMRWPMPRWGYGAITGVGLSGIALAQLAFFALSRAGLLPHGALVPDFPAIDTPYGLLSGSHAVTPAFGDALRALAGSALYGAAVMGMVAWVIVRRLGASWSSMGFRPERRVGRARLDTGVVSMIMIGFGALLGYAILKGLVPQPLEPAAVPYLPIVGNALGFAAALASLALVPALVEETVFRGLLYHRLRAQFGAGTSIFTSAIVFALGHRWEPRTLALTFALGLVTALLVERHHSLYPAIGVHFVKNAVALSLAAIS